MRRAAAQAAGRDEGASPDLLEPFAGREFEQVGKERLSVISMRFGVRCSFCMYLDLRCQHRVWCWLLK
eukprot:21747-Eustigmatos_ZCMA.PRE.1